MERFADQWLQTALLGNVSVDRNYYPKFKDSIKELMHRETHEAVNDAFSKRCLRFELSESGSRVREPDLGFLLQA